MKNLSIEQLEKWMMYYYENPQPDITPIAIETLREKGHLSSEVGVEGIMAFLSFIFRFHPEKIETWLATFKEMSIQEKVVIIHALWYSSTLEAKNYLRTILETADSELKDLIIYLLSESPTQIEQIPISSPGILDMLWSAFAATGDEKYVIKLMSVLPYINTDGDTSEKMIGDAARWSLASNVMEHNKVKIICLSQLNQQSPEVTSILENILQEAENQRL